MAGYAGASSVTNPEGELGAETSPDLLKNTSSNISRLEDVIEHCKGRRKYLARTSSPSNGEDVPWYFCKVPLAVKELAASIPRSEIVWKSDYFRFSMRDSLAFEASFLQREEELLSYWWKEYAECSEGPCLSAASSKSSSVFEDDTCNDVYSIDEERVGVPVKGGLYEVDLKKRHCFPVYWSGENRRVLRGHWFARKGHLDWLAVREDVAEQLELAYRCQDELRQQKEEEMDDYCLRFQLAIWSSWFMVLGKGWKKLTWLMMLEIFAILVQALLKDTCLHIKEAPTEFFLFLVRNYWRDYDTALFILRHLYRDIPEERSFDEEPEGEGTTKDKGWEVELFFHQQALDEDTPLTFYDKFARQEFSWRARKAMHSSRQH